MKVKKKKKQIINKQNTKKTSKKKKKQFNISYPVTGAQKCIEIDDDKKW